MTLWCHGSGYKPPLTASHTHIGCTETVWAPSYAVDGHMGAPLHCYTCAGGGQMLENWGKVKPKWWCGVMVEAVNHHWLHLTSILDVYKVIEHLHMLWIGMDAPLHCYSCAGEGQILENWGKAEPKWRGVMVQAVNHHLLHPTSILDIESVWAPSYAVDGHMGAPLHCYTCAGGGQMLENWGKAEPTTLKQTKMQNNLFLLIYYFFCRWCCQNLGIFAIMGNSMTWTSNAVA